jgi:HD-GYP domain-containing protein (c-di-GMP phosphodiesterase class II)
MMYMSGICGILAVLAMVTRTLSVKRRRTIALLEVSAMLLLIFDRYAYIYRGDISLLGYRMVRISNFMVYFLTLFLCHCLNIYLSDLFVKEGKLEKRPLRIIICEVIFSLGCVMLIYSQFTGLYYTFDENNIYQRSPGNFICYIFPFLILILQLSAVVQYRKRLSKLISISITLCSVVPLLAAMIQAKFYGLSLINMSIVGMAIVLYVLVLIDLNEEVERSAKREVETQMLARLNEHAMFEQTAEALANAIDAKDKYTHGHSSRVAMYSEKIAKMAGMSEEECENVYFAGLLHDVGKIGVPGQIINKEGRLTDEEFAQIKLHPVYGDQILASINKSPYLSIGARHHHERYDGHGYPDGLKGEDIPEVARIISVADAYDAMTSKRSYRDPIPQDKVREELVKGIGTQFDPKYAQIMLNLLDHDTDYSMKEQEGGGDPLFKSNLNCTEILSEFTIGIPVTNRFTRIDLRSKPDPDAKGMKIPSLIIFDALDGRIHKTDAGRKNFLYLEYARIRFDGDKSLGEARKIETKTILSESFAESSIEDGYTEYKVESVRCEDHLLVRISDSSRTFESIVALPDSSRYTYICLTGENCHIRNINYTIDEIPAAPGYIPRIAEEVSFIRDLPVGDIPNVQVDRWRSSSSEGIPVKGDLKIRFHAMSLPTSRLIWHCPFVTLYTSYDGKVGGPGFREFALIRFDGENLDSDRHADNKVFINRTADFHGWNDWKERFREGLDCEVEVLKDENVYTIKTENLGIVMEISTTIYDEVEEVYVALTGDQCAISDIRISHTQDV